MFHTAFIDFDHTLYDTYREWLDIFDVLARHRIPRKDAEETYELAVRGTNGGVFDYSFDRHIAILAERGLALSDAVARELEALHDRSYQAADAESFLQYVREQSARLVLLTAGNEKFQRQKIDSTTLAPYFDVIHVLHEKKDGYVRGVANPAGKHLFVNDNLRENVTVHATCPNVVVVTKRHPVKYSEQELKASEIPYFNSLTDIISYLISQTL